MLLGERVTGEFGGIGVEEADDKGTVLSFLAGMTNVGRKVDVDWLIDNICKVDLVKADEVLGVIVVVSEVIDVLVVAAV